VTVHEDNGIVANNIKGEDEEEGRLIVILG
jgi:hypothetical protein